MASIILSSEEKHFILTGVEDDFRNDGRSNEDYRRIAIKTRVLSNTNGSADITLVGYVYKIHSPIFIHNETERFLSLEIYLCFTSRCCDFYITQPVHDV